MQVVDFVNYRSESRETFSSSVFSEASASRSSPRLMRFDSKGMIRDGSSGFDSFRGTPRKRRRPRTVEGRRLLPDPWWHPVLNPGTRSARKRRSSFFGAAGSASAGARSRALCRYHSGDCSCEVPRPPQSSTSTATCTSPRRSFLDGIAPILQEGTVLLFDEWFSYKGNPTKGEARAFFEFLEAHPEWGAQSLSVLRPYSATRSSCTQMRIAHVGPPLMRTGGPAGYLLELRRQADETDDDGRHQVRFPELSSRPPVRRRSSLSIDRLRRWKRAIVGPPRFYRPSPDEMRRERGVIDDLLTRAAEDSVALSPTVFRASCRRLLRARRTRRGGDEGESGRWRSLAHGAFPHAHGSLSRLELGRTRNRPWEEIASLPDVKRWIEKELEIWRLVDRVVLPCPEALDELVRVDPRFADAARRWSTCSRDLRQ